MSTNDRSASMERAVVDRVVDGRSAVLLLGAEAAERVVPVERLPAGAREGSWLRVRFSGDELAEAELDPRATDRAKKRVAGKVEELRRRGRRLGPKP